LVSDVLDVVNQTTLTLADVASTTVANVEVVLNRPDRVGLSDPHLGASP
jgi:hypothetical protein